MRTVTAAGLFILLAASAADAQPRAAAASSMILARAGSFVSSESAFADIYGNGIVYGGELRVAIGPGGRRFALWLDGNHRARSGRLSFTGEGTRVKVTAAEGGLQYRFGSGRLAPHAGIGAGFYFFDERSEALGTARKNAVGICGTAGLAWAATSRLVVDVRVKYSTAKLQPAAFRVDVGGLTTDVGVGIRF